MKSFQNKKLKSKNKKRNKSKIYNNNKTKNKNVKINNIKKKNQTTNTFKENAIITKCENCNNFNHSSENCLVNPTLNIDQNNIKCLFCGSNKHFICPMKKPPFIIYDYDSDDGILSFEENENQLNHDYSNNNIINNDFYSILLFFQREIKKKKKLLNYKIFPDVQNDEIYNIIFCYKCGGRHSSNCCC